MDGPEKEISADRVAKKSLGEMLIEENLITAEQLVLFFVITSYYTIYTITGLVALGAGQNPFLRRKQLLKSNSRRKSIET